MSSPEENARPAPVMTMTRTAGSSPSAVTQSMMPKTIAHRIALSFSGRFSVIVATPSVRSKVKPSTSCMPQWYLNMAGRG